HSLSVVDARRAYLLYCFFYEYVDLPDLHSFPTRRSSDLRAHQCGTADHPQRADLRQQTCGANLRRQRRPGTAAPPSRGRRPLLGDRKSTRLNSSHVKISYAVFCLKKKNKSNRFELI